MPRVRKRGGRGGARGAGRGKLLSTKSHEKRDDSFAFHQGLTGLQAGVRSPQPGSSSMFNSTDMIYGSSLDVFQEVIVEDEITTVNIENSNSASPISVTNETYSNENSVSSFSASEQQNKYWTREDLTPSEVLPDNLFTDNDEDMKSFSLDMGLKDIDNCLNINDGSPFTFSSLFPVKEELKEESREGQTEAPESVDFEGVVKSELLNDETQKKQTKRKMKPEASEATAKLKVQIMSEYEEKMLLRRLQRYAESDSLDPAMRRLYRKLAVRNQKRTAGMEPFNFDRLVAKLAGQEWTDSPSDAKSQPKMVVGASNILDRFQKVHASSSVAQLRLNISFRMRLVGSGDDFIPQPIVSPYTGRTLKPYIRRDYESRPLKLKILEKIREKCTDPEIKNRATKPIDYVYVQPHHIPAINAICKEFFWDGIDIAECLEYPDFTCVVLYGHVIVGFAFMVPDVSYNEAYISYLFTHPEWRGAGIARFMLYHLIQSCMGKDLTLHVSATNNAAMNLYHTFGFKVQEFVVDFYDKYYPADSSLSKHAFFMRLTR